MPAKPLRLLAATWLVLCALSPALTSAAEPDSLRDVIVQHEKAALEVFKTHDKTAFLKLVRPDFYEITSGGEINGVSEQLQELDEYVLGNYRMDDVVVTVVSPTVALIRYKVTAEYSFKGKKLPVQPVLANAVWIKEGTTWRAALYEEVLLKKE